MNKEFEIYRVKLGYSPKTMKLQDYHVKKLLDWCINNEINYLSISNDAILKYISEQKERRVEEPAINNALNALSVYYGFLVKENKIGHNRFENIRLRSSRNKLVHNTLKPEQLDKLYHDFCNIPVHQFKSNKSIQLHKRNCTILGLLIYQGITTGELSIIEKKNINLKEGKIYIPSTRRSNSRALKLQSNQIVPLQNYLITKEEDFLFNNKKMTDLISRIIKQVKEINPNLTDSRQIRQSYIMNQLKQHNIRQVQYMAGHKKIKSTEHYQQQDMTNLIEQVNIHHPMK